MIKFRQKSFIAPAVGLLARAGSVLSKAGSGSKLLGALNMGGQASMITSPITGMIQQNTPRRRPDPHTACRRHAG